MTGTAPSSLFALREEVERWLEAGEGLVLGLDFDGTLAPISDDPDEPTIDPALRDVIRELHARPNVLVVVISGRGLDDLRSRVDIPGLSYAGNHGLEIAHDGEARIHPSAEAHWSAIDGLCGTLRSRLDDIPGTIVENKGITATVHFRRTPDEAVPRVVDIVERSVAEASDDLRVSSGKQIKEIRPPVEWDKGRALQGFIDGAPAGWRTMYVGDDVTDEDAFEVLAESDDGVGIRVGSGDVETSAAYRVDSQREVARFLDWVLARARWESDPESSPGLTGESSPF